MKPLLLFIVEISMLILNKDSDSVDFFVMYWNLKFRESHKNKVPNVYWRVVNPYFTSEKPNKVNFWYSGSIFVYF